MWYVAQLLRTPRADEHGAGVKLLPPHCTGDQDDATLNAPCRVWNGMSFQQTLQELKKRLGALADTLYENDLLGVPLDEENPPPIGLPIPGFQLNEGAYCFKVPLPACS